jgi:surface antigen
MANRLLLNFSLIGASMCAVISPVLAQSGGSGPIDGVLSSARGAVVPKPPGTGLFSSIFGCSASGSKQEIGAAVGGVTGGLLGNRVAGGGNRTIGTVVGTAVGAAAGSALGCKLQRNDQAKAEAALSRSAETGQAQSWSNQSTGSSGSTRVLTDQSRGVTGLALAPGVDPITEYQRIDGYYTAASRVNVRSAPGLEGAILGQLALNERVWVPAAASSGDWLLVTRNGVGQGYVSSAFLTPELSTATECKIVRQTITVGGQSESQDLRACREPSGGWTFNPVTG